MSKFEHDGIELGQIHKKNNDKKFYCHFTGFLEGIAASGYLEAGEENPLLAECKEFVRRVSNNDAEDIIQDFDADLLDHSVISDAADFRLKEIDFNCVNSSTNRFLGFCRGVVCDGVITLAEAELIKARIENDPNLETLVGVRQILVTCLDALEDGIISDAESLEICNAIGEIVGDNYGDTGLAQTFGTVNYQETQIGDILTDLQGKTIVLTGSFHTKPRSKLEQELAGFGAKMATSVSGTTDILIVGGEASRDWIEMNRGTKIRKAQELRLKSKKPDLVSEGQLRTLIAKSTL